MVEKITLVKDYLTIGSISGGIIGVLTYFIFSDQLWDILLIKNTHNLILNDWLLTTLFFSYIAFLITHPFLNVFREHEEYEYFFFLFIVLFTLIISIIIYFDKNLAPVYSDNIINFFILPGVVALPLIFYISFISRFTSIIILLLFEIFSFFYTPYCGVCSNINNIIGMFIPQTIIFSFSFLGGICGAGFNRLEVEHHRKEKIKLNDLKSVPGLINTAISLSAKANKLFLQKNYTEALKTFQKSLDNFIEASDGAKSLNDVELGKIVSNRILSLQENIIACKNALGADITVKAKSKFEKGELKGAIQTYEESLKYFQDADLISKTKVNIENCYIEIDARKVEELSTQAVSLLNTDFRQVFMSHN